MCIQMKQIYIYVLSGLGSRVFSYWSATHFGIQPNSCSCNICCHDFLESQLVYNGPGRFGGVAGFFVFSQQLLTGQFRLSQVRVKDCPAGLQPPQALKIGEKLVGKCELTRHATKPTRSSIFNDLAADYHNMDRSWVVSAASHLDILLCFV